MFTYENTSEIRLDYNNNETSSKTNTSEMTFALCTKVVLTQCTGQLTPCLVTLNRQGVSLPEHRISFTLLCMEMLT